MPDADTKPEPSINRDPSTYALVYEHGRARIADQTATLKEARDRASTLITAASAVATLAISLAFRDKNVDLDPWGVAGVVAAGVGFLAVAAAAVAVWQRVTLTVNMNPSVILDHYVERPGAPMSLVEMHSELALWLGKFADDNATAIDKRLRWFQVGVVGLAIETGGLTAMLMNVALG